MEKLKNYVKYRDLLMEKEGEDTVEGHLRVIGGEMEELSREKVVRAKGKRMAEFQRQKEFPAGVELKRAIESGKGGLLGKGNIILQKLKSRQKNWKIICKFGNG